MHFFKEGDLVWNRLFCFTQSLHMISVLNHSCLSLPPAPISLCAVLFSVSLWHTTGSPNTVWFRLPFPGKKALWLSACFRGKGSELLKDPPGQWTSLQAQQGAVEMAILFSERKPGQSPLCWMAWFSRTDLYQCLMRKVPWFCYPRFFVGSGKVSALSLMS